MQPNSYVDFFEGPRLIRLTKYNAILGASWPTQVHYPSSTHIEVAFEIGRRMGNPPNP